MKKTIIKLIPYVIGFIIGAYVYSTGAGIRGFGTPAFYAGKYGADFYTEIADTTMDIYRATYYGTEWIKLTLEAIGLIDMSYFFAKIYNCVFIERTSKKKKESIEEPTIPENVTMF